MAKIPQHIAQISPSTQPALSQIPRMGTTGAEDIGQAVSNLGRAGRNIAADMFRQDQFNLREQEQEQAKAKAKAEALQLDTDKLAAENASVLAQTRALENEITRENSMPAGGNYKDGKSFFQQTNDDNNVTTDEFAQGLTPGALEIYEKTMLPFNGKQGVKALQKEATEHTRFTIQSYLDLADNSINLINVNPEEFQNQWNQISESIADTSNLGARSKEEILRKIGPMFAEVPLQLDLNNAMTNSDVAKKMVKDIDSGAYSKYVKKTTGLDIDPDTLQKFRDKADTLSRTGEFKKSQELTDARKDVLASAKNGAPISTDVVDSVTANLNPEEKASWIKDLDIVKSTRKHSRSIDINPTDFLENKLPKLKDGLIGPGAAANSDQYDYLKKEAETALEDLRKNPAEKTNEWISRLSPEFLKGAPPEEVKSLMIAYQNEQGVPPADQEVLGPKDATNKVKQILTPDALNPQGQGQKTLQVLGDLQKETGAYYSIALRELTKAGLPDGYRVLTWAQGTLPEKNIIDALPRKTDDLEKSVNLPTEQLKGIRANIKAAIDPYVKTIGAGGTTPSKNTWIAALEETVYKAALQQSITSGQKPGDATNSIIKSLITDRITINGTYAVPKAPTGGKPYSLGLITKTLDADLRNLPRSSVHSPYKTGGPSQISDDNYYNSVKDGGFWVNTSDSKGVKLFVNVGGYPTPVRGKNGAEIIRSFRNMTDQVLNSKQPLIDRNLSTSKGK